MNRMVGDGRYGGLIRGQDTDVSGIVRNFQQQSDVIMPWARENILEYLDAFAQSPSPRPRSHPPGFCPVRSGPQPTAATFRRPVHSAAALRCRTGDAAPLEACSWTPTRNCWRQYSPPTLNSTRNGATTPAP